MKMFSMYSIMYCIWFVQQYFVLYSFSIFSHPAAVYNVFPRSFDSSFGSSYILRQHRIVLLAKYVRLAVSRASSWPGLTNAEHLFVVAFS